MQHTGTVTLETPRLLLRRFRQEDVVPMYRNWASDPEVTKFLTWPTHPSEEVTDTVIADWVSHYTQENYYQWAIELKELGEAIGSIAVVYSNDAIGKAHIGYCIGRPWWHRGIMSEALAAVMRHLFDTVGMHRIEAVHDVNNPHSGGVMRKCGMTLEGIHRQAGRNNLGICDEAWYAALAEDQHRPLDT